MEQINELDILIPNKKEIVVGNKKYHIGKLGIRQQHQIGKFVLNFFVSSQERLKEYQDKTKDSTSNITDMMTFLDMLNPEDILKIFSIILRENDIEFLENNLDFSTELLIIATVIEYLNIEDIKKNFNLIKISLQKKEITK